MIEKKEKGSFSYERKLKDVKLYVKYMSYGNGHSKPTIELDIKYNDKFRNLSIYYRKPTERIFNKFENNKRKLIQTVNKKYPQHEAFIREDIKYIDITYNKCLRVKNIEKHYCACLFYQFYNEINKEKMRKQHKLKSLLYLMIYKNIPQDIVRYCIKSYL